MIDVLDQLTDAELLQLYYEQDGAEWARHYFPQSFTRPFTRYQKEFWEWGLMIEPDTYYRPRVECEPRGVGKSTNGQAWIASLLARFKRKTVGYVSREDDKATQHFNSIKRKLENPELLKVYPHLKPRVQKYRNAFSSWSQDRLVTEAGQMVIPITLLGSRRGYKSEDDVRFDLIVLDDIDKLGESLDLRRKNLELLKSEILAAGYAHTLVVVLQNLVHKDSICSMILDHRADILSERIFCGPYPLMKWYDAEKIDLEDGAKRWQITAGEPYDEALDIPYCESLLNQFGKATFDRECQQETRLISGEKSFREYNEIWHVSTWEELALVYGKQCLDIDGQPRISARWNKGRGLDWGTTPEHPTAVIHAARPHALDPHNSLHLTFGEIVRPLWPPLDPHNEPEMVSPGRVATAIKQRYIKLLVNESEMKLSLMSHEASAALATLLIDLPDHLKTFFAKWKPKRGAGVPQVQEAMAIDWSRFHALRRYPKGYLFRRKDHPAPEKAVSPYKEGENVGGKLLWGFTRFVILSTKSQGALYVEDGKLVVLQPTDEEGCVRLRSEIPEYNEFNTGASKIFDDAVNALCGMATRFFVDVAPMSDKEIG